MKSIFGWLLWAALAVAAALLMGDNPATVSLFWPPWRVDVSFNLVVIALALGFALLYGALRGVALLRDLPRRARRWRALQHERATVGLLLQAQGHLLAGRFVRARNAAREAIERLNQPDAPAAPWRGALWVLAHLAAAESAHALGQTAQRDAWLQAALAPEHGHDAPSAREGALLRAAQWALEAGDAAAAAEYLAALPQGAARRIQAVRLRLRLAQLRHDTAAALEMARLLAKHRALSPEAAQTLLRSLWRDAVRAAADAQALLAIWRGLQGSERQDPQRALEVLRRAQALAWPALDGGLPRVVDEAIRVAWAGYDRLAESERCQWAEQLDAWLPQLEPHWLARLEEAQQRWPQDPVLQYVAGQACRVRGLWGKAQLLLQQAARGLPPGRLQRRAWVALAELAQQRGEPLAAQQAWEQAARADL
ncbi:heme biosynthesis-associated TPR protein [Tepidimonas alkaliphilus]|uniref:Heme biosynthesis-associated TPR protein n=1 Tax=Tepidimonas alkaliphilus TaxID=2588942 RepID=A0A554WCU9_9BURK|nr:heme biosynthesis HemY N-terminal domain-containing protein [Tepidimonas alkaliphilus]TSE21406.1 heme biosynthesis-associated TPR protein [Tepidimonas alkaliphilus]